MEIVEIISHYIDKNQNIINVEFKLLGDDEDIVREENEDTLISFLNEYYIVYPKKLPKGQMKWKQF